MDALIEKIVLEHSMNPFAGQINDKTDLIEDLEIDSLGLVDIIVCIEDQFHITFPNEFLILDNIRSYVKITEKVKEILPGGQNNA